MDTFFAFLFLIGCTLFLESVVIAILKKIGKVPDNPNKVRAFFSIAALFICAMAIVVGHSGDDVYEEDDEEIVTDYDDGYVAGMDTGYDEGYDDGYSVGYKKGVKKGKKKALASVSDAASSTTAESAPTTNDTSESDAYKKGQEAAEKLNKFISGESTGDEELSESDYKSLCQTLDYNDILRNPDSYKGKYAVISGKVDQIIEGWFGSYSIFINDGDGNKWGCTYYYKDGESHILEGDYVTVYGECDGTDTSETVLGKQVTMPRVDLEYIN